MFNVSATLNVSRLLYNPSLCLPHVTVKSFDQMIIPFKIPGHPEVQIKGVVVDKDNCFAKDHDDKVWPEYKDTWAKLQQTYPKERLLIVSNSAGTDDDTNYSQAERLEQNTGSTVLRHSVKKPGCLDEIKDYFAKQDVLAHEILIVGDRLFTDILMANMMGSWGLWLSDGVEQSQKVFPKMERSLYYRLVTSRPEDPYVPPVPATPSSSNPPSNL
ncbi:mitochondrial PGP phosphatase-domain-containing protein [Scheffersomyces xylosifermentans]|uniref:mitochondrial PGP phosphatase-domain-containing protein n=1 Tax=Scheffersomyces xylosifermentans TaxID=1304137 RepID=UPI00315DE3CD